MTWNPQQATGSKIADMEDGGWVSPTRGSARKRFDSCLDTAWHSQNHYVCIEPGYVKDFKTLQPGEEWIGQQVLSVAK